MPLLALAVAFALGGVLVPAAVVFLLAAMWGLLPVRADGGTELMDTIEGADLDALKDAEKNHKGQETADDTDENGTPSQSRGSPSDEEIGADAYMTAWVTVSREYFIYPTGGPRNSLNPPAPDKNEGSLSQNESAYSSLYRLVANNTSKLSAATASDRSGVATSDAASIASGATGSGTPSSDPSGRSSAAKSNKTKSLSKLSKYYAVLQHGNILLYHDSDRLKLRHVIMLERHAVMIWPPNVPEAELYLKRSAICLVKKDSADGLDGVVPGTADSPPADAFYLYSDNCSEKEDLYFALIRATKGFRWGDYPEFDPVRNAKPLRYSDADMLTLINDVQLNNDDPHSRWLSALFGRWFLAVKNTDLITNYLHRKVTSKLERVKRPSYLGPIEVRRISPGSAVPHFSRMRVRELSAEGNLVVEANVRYAGGVAVEIATKASLALGSRFNPDISLVLAVALRSLEGKLVLKIKPPPSNRIWYAFEAMPSMALQIEPVVSSKQVKLKYITNQIENRIREVFKETMVLPFMDDISLYDTSPDFYRGGIWDRTVQPSVAVRAPPTESDEAFEEFAAHQAVRATGRDESASAPEGLGLRRRASTISSEVDSDITSVLDLDDGTDSGSMARSEGSGDARGVHAGSGREAVKQQTKNLVGTVKKWSNWYFKDKKRGAQFPGDPGPADQGTGEPIQAPLPHTFPPEVLSQINGSSDPSRPYQPAPEMTVPKAYPAPPVPGQIPGHRRNTSSLSSNDVETASAPAETETTVPPRPPVAHPPAKFPKRKPVGTADTSELYTPWRPSLHSQPKTTAATSETSAIVTSEPVPEPASEQTTDPEAAGPSPQDKIEPHTEPPTQQAQGLAPSPVVDQPESSAVSTASNGSTDNYITADSSSTIRQAPHSPVLNKPVRSGSYASLGQASPGPTSPAKKSRRSSSSSWSRTGISVQHGDEPENIKFHPSPPSLPTTVSNAHASSTTSATRTRTVKRKQVGSGASQGPASDSARDAALSPASTRSSPYKQTTERLVNVDPSECILPPVQDQQVPAEGQQEDQVLARQDEVPASEEHVPLTN